MKLIILMDNGDLQVSTEQNDDKRDGFEAIVCASKEGFMWENLAYVLLLDDNGNILDHYSRLDDASLA